MDSLDSNRISDSDKWNGETKIGLCESESGFAKRNAPCIILFSFSNFAFNQRVKKLGVLWMLACRLLWRLCQSHLPSMTSDWPSYLAELHEYVKRDQQFVWQLDNTPHCGQFSCVIHVAKSHRNVCLRVSCLTGERFCFDRFCQSCRGQRILPVSRSKESCFVKLVGWSCEGKNFPRSRCSKFPGNLIDTVKRYLQVDFKIFEDDATGIWKKYGSLSHSNGQRK